MIRVKVLTLNDAIRSLVIKGHAGYADKGQDLVCAAVSSISIGLCNALDHLAAADCKITLEENRIEIEASSDNEKLQTILNTGLIQLQTVEEQFSEFVRIEKTEVRQ